MRISPYHNKISPIRIRGIIIRPIDIAILELVMYLLASKNKACPIPAAKIPFKIAKIKFVELIEAIKFIFIKGVNNNALIKKIKLKE